MSSGEQDFGHLFRPHHFNAHFNVNFGYAVEVHLHVCVVNALQWESLLSHIWDAALGSFFSFFVSVCVCVRVE